MLLNLDIPVPKIMFRELWEACFLEENFVFLIAWIRVDIESGCVTSMLKRDAEEQHEFKILNMRVRFAFFSCQRTMALRVSRSLNTAVNTLLSGQHLTTLDSPPVSSELSIWSRPLQACGSCSSSP